MQVNMKKFIKEKYADILLQICCEYENTHPTAGDRMAQAVERSLGTLDKYSNYILGMGYMIETEDIPYLKEYIVELEKDEKLFSRQVLTDTHRYLAEKEREDVF